MAIPWQFTYMSLSTRFLAFIFLFLLTSEPALASLALRSERKRTAKAIESAEQEQNFRGKRTQREPLVFKLNQDVQKKPLSFDFSSINRGVLSSSPSELSHSLSSSSDREPAKSAPSISPTGINQVESLADFKFYETDPGAPESPGKFVNELMDYADFFEFTGSAQPNPDFQLALSTVVDAIKSQNFFDLAILYAENNIDFTEKIIVDGVECTLLDLVVQHMGPVNAIAIITAILKDINAQMKKVLESDI